MIDDGADAQTADAPAAGGATTDEQLAGMAYHEQLVSTEGQIRDAKGRVIFNKNTKRGRARELEGGAMVRAPVPVCEFAPVLTSALCHTLCLPLAGGRRAVARAEA